MDNRKAEAVSRSHVASKAAAEKSATSPVYIKPPGDPDIDTDQSRFEAHQATIPIETPPACPTCHGKGMVGGALCTDCNATGVEAA